MRLRTMTLALFFAGGVLAACHGGTTGYLPQGTGGSPNASAFTAHWPLEGEAPDVASLCNVAPVRVPGKHVTMIAFGDVSGTSFSGAGIWFLESFTRGTPGPTPTPGVTPTPVKGTPPEWLYYGTYTLKIKKESGCALLIATQSGRPFHKQKYNALSIDTPIPNAKYVRIGALLTNGTLSTSITGLSATSGNGTATLLTAKGAPYDTATISIAGRISIR